MRGRPRLRTILLLVNVAILALPLAGIWVLRLYEDALVQRTEAELIVQGALVRETFLRDYRERRGTTAEEASPPAFPTDHAAPSPESAARLPRLVLSGETVRPPAPDPLPARGEPDPAAAEAGRGLTPVLRRAGLVSLSGIRVVDRDGIVVATTRGELGLSLAHREEVARALRGEEVSLLRQRISDMPPPPLASLSRGERHRVFVALPIRDGEQVVGAVVLSRTPLDLAKALYLHRGVLAFGGVVLLAVVAVVAVLTSLAISRPVRRLIAQAEGVARGGRGTVEPLARPGTLEIARLSEALSRMSRTLERRAEAIRSYASHVSHEFKTPLTAIRGTTELLRDHLTEMKPEERERFLDALDEAAKRLERLVARLLEQARADLVAPGGETCDVDATVGRAVERARAEGLRVEVDGASGGAEAAIAGAVLEEVIAAVLDNARQHGGAGVTARISARVASAARPPSDPVCEIVVSDDGPGISEANGERIFTPFFTTARERGGTGLGLSIARSLVEAHAGSIELARARPGAVFAIRLPVRPRPAERLST